MTDLDIWACLEANELVSWLGHVGWVDYPDQTLAVADRRSLIACQFKECYKTIYIIQYGCMRAHLTILDTDIHGEIQTVNGIIVENNGNRVIGNKAARSLHYPKMQGNERIGE